MKKLIIAEKPSVAKELSRTLKGCTKTKEYYENEDYIITSLYGHLLELYRMEDYNKEFKVWNIKDLPYFPEDFKWKIKAQKGIRERYNLIEKLILKKEVNIIINCGDNDREGEVLVNNLIYDIFRKNKIQKTIKRILLQDLAESTIQEELNNLRDIKDTENWYKEGLARTYIDWIYGINFSRFVSIKAKDKFPVGRVIVPTVKFIYDREQEIINFKEEKYIQLEGIIKKDNKEIKIELGDKVKLEKGQEEKQKKDMLEAAGKISNGKITVLDIEQKELIKKPKKLFSLKTLQNYMFNKYKIKISNTLNYAQSLYEKTYTTYPRTNSEYLTEEEKDKVKEIINKLVKQENLNIDMKDDKKIFDSKKVESHSAIIITGNKVDNKELTEDENKLYNSIRNRFLANFCKDDCVIEEQIVKFKNQTLEGKIKGTVIKQKGYLEFENDLTEKDIPNFLKGEEIDIKFKVVEKTTTPPGKVTEAELNNFYENPFKKEKREKEDETTDEDYIAIMEGCEIGTPATRAGIIEKVKQEGYIIENKSNLEITDKGIKLIEILEELGINLYKEKTVEISKDLKAIYNNKNSIDNILERVKEEVKQGINKKAEITEFKKTAIGKCPICKKDMLENNKSYYCEDWENCGFSIWKQICSKKLSSTIIKELLEKGKTKEIKGFKSKQGKTFSASLIIEDNKVKLNFENSKRT